MNNKKVLRLTYLISTGLISALMLFSASMYFNQHAMVRETFTALGYPTYIIYPLAVLKVLGLIAIWSNYSKSLREWAYAGFFFDFVLAVSAHLSINDGQHMAAAAAIVLLFISYFSDRRLSGMKE